MDPTSSSGPDVSHSPDASHAPPTPPASAGIIAFLYCTQFLTLPIEAAMAKPDEYAFAVWSVFSVTAAANVCFGLLCVCTWRHNIHEIVILNISSGLSTSFAKICLCIDLLFSYPLVLFPAFEMIEGAFGQKGWMCSDAVSVWPRNLLRTATVISTGTIALSVPHFALLTGISKPRPPTPTADPRPLKS
jgi:proton-coupled amino acid transporter